MYMVLRTFGGRDFCEIRSFFRRSAAERDRANKARRDPSGAYRVERVSFWNRDAFHATVFKLGVYVLFLAGLAFLFLRVWLAFRP